MSATAPQSAPQPAPSPASGLPEPHPGRVTAIYTALGRFVVRFRWAILVFWIVVVAFTSAVMPSLSSEINGNNSAFLSNHEPSIKAANLAAPLTGSGTGTKISVIQVVAASNAPLTAGDEAALERAVTLIDTVPGVKFVKLAGLSRDGEAASLSVHATASQSDIQKDKTLIDNIVATFKRADLPAGVQMNVAGQIATAVANQVSSTKQGNQTQIFSVLFVIVLLLIVFRSPLAALITLIPSVFALLISMRLIGALASGGGGLQISEITEILLIVLLIGAGTDYGLFLVFRVRENMRDGLEPHDAVARAVISVGESITASAGTVILALLTLLFATFGLYHDLGLPLAIGVAVMLLIGLTLQPALLAIFGRRAFWPAIPRPGQQKEGLWGKVATRLVARPGLTLGVGVLLFLGLAAGALGYKAGGFGGSTTAPGGSSAARGNAALAKHFPSSANNPANIVFTYSTNQWTTPQFVAAGDSLTRSGQFKQIAGPLDPNGTTITTRQLRDLYERLGPPEKLPLREPARTGVSIQTYNAYRADALFISSNGKVMQFEAALKAGTQDSTAAMNATPNIRRIVAAAAKSSQAADSGLTGEAAAVYDINDAANNDLALIVPIAIVAIGLLLAAVLRSAIAPLYLIISVGLSFLAALGAATIVFLDIGNDGGITFVLPFLLFLFLLALGEDYNILVMTRIREEARHMPLKDAVIKAVSRSGSTVTTAGIILGGTFAVFAIVGGGGGGKGAASFAPIGFGCALGILMDTFLVRTLLVPSTVMLLGRWNWWPSKLSADDGEPADGPEPGFPVPGRIG